MSKIVKLELSQKIDFLINVKREFEPLKPLDGQNIFRQLSHTQFEWCSPNAVGRIMMIEKLFEILQKPRVMKDIINVNFSNDDSELELLWNKHTKNFTIFFNGQNIGMFKTINPFLVKAKMIIENELLFLCDKEDEILSKL